MKLKSLVALSFVMLSALLQAQHTEGNTKNNNNKTDFRKVKVTNTDDPICKMKTAHHISDTAVYKSKIYGFCSSHCKSTFKKMPKKYLN